jgi:hypothetical protein
MRRVNANQIVLGLLALVLLLVGIDVGRRLVAGDPDAPPPPQPPSFDPAFKEGDRAPDFVLPDEKGQPRRLSELVKGDTVLTFSCGCNNCRQFQTYLGKLAKLLGPKAPSVISVNTTRPEAHEAWARDTELKQTFLYGKHDLPDTAPYKGEPCPRAFRLNGRGEVLHIGVSPGQPGQNATSVSYDLAKAYDFKVPGDDTPGKRPAPKAEGPLPLPMEMTNPKGPPQIGSTPGERPLPPGAGGPG